MNARLCIKKVKLLTRLWVIWVKLTQGTRRGICGWNKPNFFVMFFSKMSVSQKSLFTDFSFFYDFNWYLICGPFYDVFTTFVQVLPVFWLWVASIIFWFLLEISIWASSLFNLKHTYVNTLARKNQLLMSATRLYTTTQTFRIFLKKSIIFVV